MSEIYHRWERKSLNSVYFSNIFNLQVERSKCMRTGVEHDFYYFKCPNWVNVIALTADDELIMIRQFRHGSGLVEFEIPGGGIESNDCDPVTAGVRELLEETGYIGENARLIGSVRPNPAIQSNVCYTVLVENCRFSGSANQEDTEDIETILIKRKNVRNMVKDGEIKFGLVLNALQFMNLAFEN